MCIYIYIYIYIYTYTYIYVNTRTHMCEGARAAHRARHSSALFGRGDYTAGNPHRAQHYPFEFVELILLLKLGTRFTVEQFDPSFFPGPLYVSAADLHVSHVRRPLTKSAWRARDWILPLGGSSSSNVITPLLLSSFPNLLQFSAGGFLYQRAHRRRDAPNKQHTRTTCQPYPTCRTTV